MKRIKIDIFVGLYVQNMILINVEARKTRNWLCENAKNPLTTTTFAPSVEVNIHRVGAEKLLVHKTEIDQRRNVSLTPEKKFNHTRTAAIST